MKEKILNSSKYKRYKFYVFLYFALFLLSLITILFSLDRIYGKFFDFKNIWNWLAILPFALVLIPAALVYLIQLIIMRTNVKDYELVTGRVLSVYTPRYFNSDSRKVTVYIEKIDRSYLTKIYIGPLFDLVANDVMLELAHNAQKQEVIILEVIYKK